jgi:hypothetical protein
MCRAGKISYIMETKGHKILKVVKIRWVSMLSLCKRILSEYRALVVKMGLDLVSCPIAKDNFNMLINLEVLLAFIASCQC